MQILVSPNKAFTEAGLVSGERDWSMLTVTP